MQASDQVDLERCTSAICRADSARSLGTGSRLGPRHYATARHVVEGQDRDNLRVQDIAGNNFRVGGINLHDSLDIAVLDILLDPGGTHSPSFQPYLMPCPIGEQVFTCGFKPTESGELVSRLLHGEIIDTHTRDRKTGHVHHSDLELDFPSTGGHSGSPVLRLARRNQIVAIITDYLEYGEEHSPLNRRTTAAIPLHAVREWLLDTLSQ